MSSPARPYIGGQAVLEGVMMRSPTSFAIVVRRKDGSLVVREKGVTDTRKGIAKIPFVRGVHSLVESLKLGGEALRFSSSHFEEDLEIADKLEKEKVGSGKGDAKGNPANPALHTLGLLHVLSQRTLHTLRSLIVSTGFLTFLLATEDGEGRTAAKSALEKEAAEKSKGGGASGLMAVFAVVFFVALPQIGAELLNKGFGLNLPLQSPMFQVITGMMKLSIVIGYMLLIRRVPEIRRVFQYHGAEHKTISTYEANEELIVANARTKTTLHPRCGTTFLVMVALISIVLFTALGGFLPKINTGHRWSDSIVFFFVKLPFLPVIAAITFEIQRIFAKYFTKGPLQVFLWPGFMVQKITTIEPDDDQLEVALGSLRATLFREHGESGESADVRFGNYESLLHAKTLRA
ncbi:MAG: DUF1385 domain-containing protein [Polyangiaceae bacterium]|nr:DUF1385 domain-containing protein [Polyangiaceae bacterium]